MQWASSLEQYISLTVDYVHEQSELYTIFPVDRTLDVTPHNQNDTGGKQNAGRCQHNHCGKKSVSLGLVYTTAKTIPMNFTNKKKSTVT